MHRVKSAARRHGRYENSYNPFHLLWTPGHSEDGMKNPLVLSQSANDICSEAAQKRRSSFVAPPPHANSMPLRPTDQIRPDPAWSDRPTDRQSDPEKESPAAPIPADTPLTQSDSTSEPNSEARKRKLFGLGPRRRQNTSENESQGEDASELKKHKQKFTAVGQFKATVLNSYINILFVFIPVGIAMHFTKVSPVVIFVMNFIAIIPLAAMLSYATEEIALRTGETIGGLLNASFGNAVELIVSIIALVHDEVLIVQTSLIGSMLSNLLLVLGMCFFFGGLNRVEQFFNITVAQTAASLLSLAVASLIIPTAFAVWSSGNDAADEPHITSLSRGTAILLLLVYGAYLYFQLKTHMAMYNEPSQKVKKRGKVGDGDAIMELANMGANISATAGGEATQKKPHQEPEDEPEEPRLSIIVAIATLCISTAFVGICAEFMVDSINDLVEIAHLSKTFVGLILLPIVGNAAEHATAVTVAIKDKMDLAIGVAVGSSMQIALLLIPFIVVLGWCMGNENMNLEFDGFQIAVLFVTVLLVNYLIGDGKSHWSVDWNDAFLYQTLTDY
ncbi:hypothetical protein MMC07_008521 [Pseudocyphellaria aurata]|nr:hypothetical protein [Pseudocyphellaria aurata]